MQQQSLVNRGFVISTFLVPMVFHLHPILQTAVLHVFEVFMWARKVKNVASAQKYEYFPVKGL